MPEPSSEACTKAGCTSALEISFDHARGSEGTYVVEVEAGGQTSRCTMTIPYPQCGEPLSRCEGTLPVTGREADLCKTPRHEQAVVPFTVGAAPEKVVVRVFRDGKKLAEEALAPSYTSVPPDGPGCEPSCKTATVVVREASLPRASVKSGEDAILAGIGCAITLKLRGVWQSGLVFSKAKVSRTGDKWLVTFPEESPKGRPQGAAVFISADRGCESAPLE